MSMSRLPHTIDVVTATTTTNAYGVTELVYTGDPTTLAAFVQPQVSEETTTGRVLTRLKVYTTAAVDVTSRVTYDSIEYECKSAVRWDDNRGQLHHYELILQQVEG